jgi:hypothetical protein
MAARNVSLNAKVAAVSFPLGALLVHVFNQLDASILPLRLFAVALLVFGVWAFSDEMDTRRPLNRAAFVSFIIAMAALVVTFLEPTKVGRQYYLVYAFGLLVSLLAWSAAYLHRDKSLKVIGAVGATIGLVPMVLLIAGHLSIGVGGALGFGALFDMPHDHSLLGTTQLNVIEAMFVLWSIVASIFLLRGGIRVVSPDR